MATKLKNMKLTSVDLVRAGANQEADIGLFKSAGPQAEYDEALVKSARSILEDPDLAEDQRAGMLAKSVDDYRAALEEPEDEPEEPDGEEVMVEKEPEEEEPADLDEIEEVEKYNHNHAADGKFTFSGGGSSGGGSKVRSGGGSGKMTPKQKKRVDLIMNGKSANGFNKLDTAKNYGKGVANQHRTTVDIFDLGRERATGRFYVADHKDSSALRATGRKPVATVGADALSPAEMRALHAKLNKSAFTSGGQFDIIEEVRKFNPFHDALGRFASKNGFKTYSANPKMKAAQPSIIRSAQAGHGKTMNVHTESKGENIGQNYDWLQTGKKPAFLTGGSSSQQTPPPPPVPKKKPKTQKPKQQPKTDPAEKPESKANESIAEAVKDVQLSSGQKLALQARDENKHACDTKKLAEDYDGVRVEGKDISGSFDARNDPVGGAAVDAVARAQGWDKAAPTVISDRDEFDKLCMQNGRVMVRTVHEGFSDFDGNKIPGAGVFHAEDVAAGTMTRSDISLGGSGATAYGGGLYMVDTGIDPGKSTKSMSARIADGQEHSWGYADTWYYKEGVQMMATLRPGAKIATYGEARALRTEFNNLPKAERERFKDKDGFPDYGAYIASKGYDGAEWDDSDDSCRYTTVYNKSALVFFCEAAFRSDMTS